MLLNCTGTLDPDATCDYARHIWYNGKFSYRRLDGGYFLWWDSANSKWVLSVVLGTPGAAYWQRTDPTILGVYTNQGTATGAATVAEGSHL